MYNDEKQASSDQYSTSVFQLLRRSDPSGNLVQAIVSCKHGNNYSSYSAILAS